MIPFKDLPANIRGTWQTEQQYINANKGNDMKVHSELFGDKVFKACVRLTEIENEMETLECEQGKLAAILKRENKEVFHDYHALTRSEKQDFIKVRDIAVEQI